MELRRSSHYDGFKSNSERDIKSVFQIDVANNQSELMRSLETFCVLQGLREERNE